MANSLQDFEKRFDIPGLHKLEGIEVTTATATDKIIENIKANRNTMAPIHRMHEWRENKPIAIVGGGPSLKSQLDKLKTFPAIIACGSVHDHLIENNIIPTYCAICDPDVIMNTYLSRHNEQTKYLIASQCDPSTFKLLEDRNSYIYHLAGDKFDQSIYGEGQIPIGGGCTVGTRAIAIAMGFGYYNMHLFGFDTCLQEKEEKIEHHAYDFNTPEEKIHDVYEIKFEVDGPTFKVAGYHLGQLFDIKSLMGRNADKMQLTVHGESLLSYFMELAQKRLVLLNEEKAKENGNGK